jgi:D-alanyl-D-alanine carboxypeptidase
VSVELLERYRRRTGVPAIGAALVPAVGEPRIMVSGERVRGSGIAVPDTARWHIGSCMKAMTAAVVARFIERGRLAWSTPVAELFGEAHPGWRRPCIADVLAHTAGVPANPTAAEMRAGLTDPAPLPQQRARLAARTLARAPDRPGRFRYSNLGYVLAGAALERLTGESFEEILAAEVLRPLGVTSAGFGPPSGPDQPWGHRAGWILRGFGLGRGPAIDPADPSLTHPPDNPPMLTPAGRLHLGLRDWSAFIRTFLAGAAPLLSAGSLERLTTHPPGVTTEQGMGWWIPRDGRMRRVMAYAQQGSNARWVASAVVAADRSTAALVVCNDGRTRVLNSIFRLNVGLLGQRE